MIEWALTIGALILILALCVIIRIKIGPLR